MKLASLLVSAALLASPLAHASLMQTTNNLLSQDINSWSFTPADSGSNSWITTSNITFGSSNSISPDRYSQTLSTVTGGTYTLSFAATIYGGVNNGLAALINGANIATVSNGSGDYNKSYNFTANSNSTVLTLLGYNGPSYSFVSNIGISQASVSPVPEPETYALMGMGLLAITLKLRKKKQGKLFDQQTA